MQLSLGFIQTIQHNYLWQQLKPYLLLFCASILTSTFPLYKNGSVHLLWVKKATTNGTDAWCPYTASYTECIVHIGLTLESL